MNPFQEMADSGGKGEPAPAAVNPFREIAAKLAAEKADAEMAAYAAAGMKPVVKKNRRWSKPGRLRIKDGPKLGNAQYSHDRYGRELAVIEDGNAELRKLSRKDFEVDEAEPRKLNFLTIRDMERAYEAMRFLHLKGLNMTLWYTCTWRSVELTTDEQVVEAIRRHVEHLRHWITEEKKGNEEETRFYYIWSVQRGEKRGLHFHMLLHLPAGIDLDLFENEVHQSIFTLTSMRPRVPADGRGKNAKRGRKKPAGGEKSAGPAEAVADDTRTVLILRNADVGEQWYRWRYLMKALDPDEGMRVRGRGRRRRTTIHEYLGLERKSHEGRYGGLRLGISQWLGPKERRIFARKYKMPHNPLWTAKDPSELYGTQFLDWARENAKPRPPKTSGLDSLGDWL